MTHALKKHKHHLSPIFIAVLSAAILAAPACNLSPSNEPETVSEAIGTAVELTALAGADQAIRATEEPSRTSNPVTMTILEGFSIDVYDEPEGKVTGTFNIEITLEIIEERAGYLLVAWEADGDRYESWVKMEDVEIFMGGMNICPLEFTFTDFTPKTFAAPDGSQPKGVLTTAVLIDLSSEPVTLEQAEATLSQASDFLFISTGFVIQMVDFATAEFTEEQHIDYPLRNMLPNCYIEEKTAIPDCVVTFSYGESGSARVFGGYALTVEGPPGFKNQFADPNGNTHLIYGMLNHYSHRFAECGYDGGDTPISSTSIGGECMNQEGTACVMKNGYSMCENAVDDLYASNPEYFAASTVVHEIMHSFGLHGNGDHYGSPDCSEEMGWDESRVFTDEDFNHYHGMCPYTYDNFVDGYQP